MTNHTPSLLAQLRLKTNVDCDTLDPGVAQLLGPFVDCTSNQAIALAELLKPSNTTVIHDAIRDVRGKGTEFGELTAIVAVEAAMVKLALRMMPHIHGNMHLQTNPFVAYNTPSTIAGARRLVKLVRTFDPEVDVSRIVIKIPSTWEGLQACRKLEAEGIKTLATTMFTFEQAVLAAEVGCHYVAPYLHDLRFIIHSPHFKEEQDASWAIENAVHIQQYFQINKHHTQVLPAALTTINECMCLAGIHHMTIAPALLQLLLEAHESPVSPVSDRLQSEHIPGALASSTQNADVQNISHQTPGFESHLTFLNDEPAFRLAVSRSQGGYNEAKQIYAINEFCNAQVKLERLVAEQMRQRI